MDTDSGRDRDLAGMWAEWTLAISAINLHSKFIAKLSTGRKDCEDCVPHPQQSPKTLHPFGGEDRNEPLHDRFHHHKCEEVLETYK